MTCSSQKMPDLLLFSSEPDPLLLESAAHFGLMIQFYPSRPWGGYVSGKLKRGVEFLRSRNEEFAMWVDGHDSLILKPESEIMPLIPLDGVLIEAERNCWPDTEMASRYPVSHGHTPRFLNSGGYCGRREILIEAMDLAISMATTEDDQRAWTAAYLDQYRLSYRGPRIMLDRDRRVFCSMGDGDCEAATSATRHWNGRVQGREEYWRARCSD